MRYKLGSYIPVIFVSAALPGVVFVVAEPVFKASPPIASAIHHSFFPEKISAIAIVTLVGGTVGGYISLEVTVY